MLVIEEDPSRSDLAAALGDEGYDVRAERANESVTNVVDSFRPHLAILDLDLPVGYEGFAITRMLRERTDTAVMFLTAADDLKDMLEDLEVVTGDYVVKPFSIAELLARVRALLRRSGHAISHAMYVGDILINERAAIADRASTRLGLTETEFRILVTMAQHHGEVLSKPQLLSLVWGFSNYDPNLVEVHMSSLRRKLEALGPRVIHTVRGAGYVMRATG